LSHHYCYLPLSWKSWNRFECAVCHIYWNILMMHGPINVKSLNNTSKWQMGFNSVFKGLICPCKFFLHPGVKLLLQGHCATTVCPICKPKKSVLTVLQTAVENLDHCTNLEGGNN
jgi:hypothetical protein